MLPSPITSSCPELAGLNPDPAWPQREFSLAYSRCTRRLVTVMTSLTQNPGKSIPDAVGP